MVKSDSISSSMKDRDKIIFSCLNKNTPNANKRRSRSFSYLKGDYPGLMDFYIQLQKADEVFQGKLIETEGLFRQNATFNIVNDTTERFTERKDCLQDYNDAITIGHVFKNSLRKFDIIPKSFQNQLLMEFHEAPSNEEKLMAVNNLFLRFPRLNMECLQIVIRIINRVARAQHIALSEYHKDLSVSSLAHLFSSVLLPGDEETEDMQTHLDIAKDLIEFIIENRDQLFNKG